MFLCGKFMKKLQINKILIITSKIHPETVISCDTDSYDYIIAADAGYLYAESNDISVDMYIGDFDSAKLPSLYKPDISDKISILPTEKDLTDSEAALDYAMSLNPKSITILGGLNSRFDHTMGNIAILIKYALNFSNHGTSIYIIDGHNKCQVLSPGKHIIPREAAFKYLGLSSLTPKTYGFFVSGTKYTLENAILSFDSTLGVSNEILEENGIISFDDGLVLAVLSSD